MAKRKPQPKNPPDRSGEQANLTIRTVKEWRGRLDELAADRDHGRSRMLHELVLVDEEYRSRMLAPYRSEDTHWFVHVASDGSMLYWIRQRLLFQEDRKKVPCEIAVKPEKKKEFEEAKEKWLINYFAVRENIGNDLAVAGNVLADSVDRDGVTSKFASLPHYVAADKSILREIVGGSRGYVQRRAKDSSYYDPADPSSVYDRADLAIDIPTRRLEFQVIIDLDLYPPIEQNNVELTYELRNRELAGFSRSRTEAVGSDIEWFFGRRPPPPQKGDDLYQMHFEAVTRWEDNFFARRLEELTREDALSMSDNRPIVEDEESRKFLRSVGKSTRKSIFGRLVWEWPPQGLVVCISWPKPPSR